MIIKFKFGDYYEIADELLVLYEEVESSDTKEDEDGNSLSVYPGRIVFPSLHVSLREGEWYVRNSPADIEDGADEYEYQSSVYIEYEENEKDINKFISYTTDSAYYLLADICKRHSYPYKSPNDISELQCYIDTSEFIDDSIAKKLLPDRFN